MAKLKEHPQKCPNCKQDEVMYERFARARGIYACDYCNWEMDALTGEILFKGLPSNKIMTGLRYIRKILQIFMLISIIVLILSVTQYLIYGYSFGWKTAGILFVGSLILAILFALKDMKNAKI